MIFLYLFLIFCIGPTFLYLLNHFHIMPLDKLNFFEKVSFSMIISLLIFILYLFIAGVITIPYSNTLVISFLILNVIILLWLIFSKRIKINLNRKKFKIKAKDFLILIPLTGIIIYLIYFIFQSISFNPLYPDEFSAWLLNAKNIYIGKKMNFFINTGLENYPNFLPLLSSGYYFFIEQIAENEVRIFSSIYLIILLIGLVGLAIRKKLCIKIMLTLFLFTIIFYEGFFSISTSSYGDIPFMVTYTLGMLYLIEWLTCERDKSLLIISSTNLMCSCFIKTDGLYLMAFNIFLFIIFTFAHKQFKLQKVSIKEAMIYNISILLLPIAWKLYNIICKFPTDLETGAGSSVELNLEYTVSLLQNMTSQFFSCLSWVLLLFIALIGWCFTYPKLHQKNKNFVILSCLTILANILFLILSYLFVFGAEALIAASFIRYMTRVIFILLIVALLLIEPIKSGE